MKFFNRVSLLFRANVNSALEKLEDPILIARQSILDLDDKIQDAKSSLMVIMGDRRILHDKIAKLDALITERSNQIEMIDGDPNFHELVSEAKSSLHELKDERDGYITQAEELNQLISSIEMNLKSTEQIRDQHKHKLNKLITESAQAKAVSKAVDIAVSLDSNNASSAFVRSEEKVSRELATAKAKLDYLSNSRSESLDDRLSRATKISK